MIHSKMNELKQKESSMEKQKSPDSKMTFSELTTALGQATQLLNCCSYGSPEWIKINERQESLYKVLREGNYK